MCGHRIKIRGIPKYGVPKFRTKTRGLDGVKPESLEIIGLETIGREAPITFEIRSQAIKPTRGSWG
jgi:hypothetical protein